MEKWAKVWVDAGSETGRVKFGRRLSIMILELS